MNTRSYVRSICIGLLLVAPAWGVAQETGQPAGQKISATIADTASIAVAQRQILDADITRAIQLINDKDIETLIDDYFPYSELQQMRSQKRTISETAKMLKGRPELLAFLKEQLVLAKTGVWDGTSDEVTAFLTTPKSEEPAVDIAAETAAPSESEAPVGIAKGYGKDFPGAMKAAIAVLKSRRYETFLVAMLPIPEVIRLNQSNQLATTASIFETHPEMATAMIADLEAIAALNPKPKDSLVTVSLPSPIPGESPREIRFQLVGGDWRFFDQTSEVTKALGPILKSEPKVILGVTGAGTSLEFERVRDHWRIKKLPNPPNRR